MNRNDIISKINSGEIKPSLSGLMKAYQAARKAIASYKLHTDMPRLNRGLGLAMRRKYGSYDRPYASDSITCTCPDCTYRPQYVCKHRLAHMLVVRAVEFDLEAQAAKLAPVTA